MDDLKKVLSNECKYHISEKMLDILFEQVEEIRIKSKESIIEYGVVNSNIYIVKSGILAGMYFDGNKEKTFGFASSGTLLLSPHSYYMGKESFIHLEACTESVVLKVSKKDFDKILMEHHEFALWMYTMAMAQIFVFEMKLSLINGTAKERYSSLFKNRPDIINSVSMKLLASYLDVTPSYLCRIKREIMREEARKK